MSAFCRVEPPALMGRDTCPVCRCNLVHCSLAWALEAVDVQPGALRWLREFAAAWRGSLQDVHAIYCRNCADVVSVIEIESEME